MAKEIPQPNKDFRDRFRSSSRFEALIKNTEAFLQAHPHIQTHRVDFQGSFAGRLFEELGYLWYIKGLEDKYRLLDTDETQTYFLQLYGGLPSQTLLQGGIFNEYLPDGVILPADGYPLKGDAVVVEYTVSAPNAPFQNTFITKKKWLNDYEKDFRKYLEKGLFRLYLQAKRTPQ